MAAPPSSRRRWLFGAGIGLALVGGSLGVQWLLYPTDRTPKGSYFRIVSAVNQGWPEGVFPYLEDAAQHACFTIWDYRRRAVEVVGRDYPPDERGLLAAHAGVAGASSGAQVFAIYARREGWMSRLRRDLSGVDRVDQAGERATVVTVGGTRYPFRQRGNGIWGLTWFTAHLLGEANRAARDLGLIERAAADYRRARGAPTSPSGSPRPPVNAESAP